jgi:hypothetical protein
MTMGATLHARIAHAFRRRGPGVRQIYVTARRASRFFKDAPRRSALATLPPTDIHIPPATGFLVTADSRFEEAPAIVAEARDALARFNASAPPPGKNRKRFLQNVLDASTLTLDSAVIRFALRSDVLAAVSEYLGVVPLLSTIAVFHSDTVEGDPTSSQLFHCDGDDVTQIKIFVYCSHVDPASGPLTALDAATTSAVQMRTGYQFRDRLTDDQVRQAVSTAKEHAFLGCPGTTVFLDTSRCFHFGSRVAPDAPPRLVTMVQYQTPYSFMLPDHAQAALPFRRLANPSLTPLQRLVLGE